MLPRAAAAGVALRQGLRAAMARGELPGLRAVRGAGLCIGLQLRSGGEAVAARDALRRRGVLVGTCGKDGATLKVRPPLAFTAAEAGIFVPALVAALAEAVPPAAKL